MGRTRVVSWSAVATLCACAVLTTAAPAQSLEEEGASASSEEAPATTALPPAVDPRLTLDLPQVPNSVLKTTLISSSVLLELGVLDTNEDETIDLHGTTAQPPPHLIVDTLPGSVAAKQDEANAEKTDEAEAPSGDSPAAATPGA